MRAAADDEPHGYHRAQFAWVRASPITAHALPAAVMGIRLVDPSLPGGMDLVEEEMEKAWEVEEGEVMAEMVQ